MKTFDEKDLITWANREKAVIGNEYYFGDTLDGIQQRFKDKHKKMLTGINGNNISFPFIFINKSDSYACILPVDAVKENKTYRPCKDLRELYITIYGDSSPDLLSNEDIIYYLVRKTIKFRYKEIKTTRYECIVGIDVHDNEDVGIKIGCSLYMLSELFDNFEIEINGKWQPFGVLEND